MDVNEDRAVHSQLDFAELNDWYESLVSVAARYDSDCIAALLHALRVRAANYETTIPIVTTTPYINTSPVHLQPGCGTSGQRFGEGLSTTAGHLSGPGRALPAPWAKSWRGARRWTGRSASARRIRPDDRDQ